MIKIFNCPSMASSLNSAIDFCGDHKPCEVIVPDKLSLFMEKFLFEKLNLTASFDIKMNTFNRFAKQDLIVDKSKQISSLGGIVLIHKILTENVDTLQVFKSKAYSFSYAEEIYKTITQLKASKITYQEMLEFSSNNLQLKDKILDLAFVYQEYEQGKAGFLDELDTFLMSTMFIEEHNKNKQLVFVGFDDFTAVQYSIIEQLAKANDVYIFVPNANGENRHIFNKEVNEQLKHIAYQNGLDLKTENVVAKTDELHTFMQNNLFATNKNTMVVDKNKIRIFSGKGDASEIELVAKDIRNNILKGKRYSDFGVAVFDLPNKVEKIKKIFAKYELNYYIDNNFKLSNSIYYKLIISLFKYNFESYNISHLIDVINSPFFECDNEQKRLLIERLRIANFRGKFTSHFVVNENLTATKNKLIHFLSYFDFNNSKSVDEIDKKIQQAYTELNFDAIFEKLKANCLSNEDAILFDKSYQTLCDSISEIEKFYVSATAEDVFDILLHIGDIVEVNNLPMTLNMVKVIDATNVTEIFDNLYLVGCNNINAPIVKNDCGIIVDSEINELNFKHKLGPTIAHINKLMKLRLFNASLMFNDTLTLVYSFEESELIKDIKLRILEKEKGREVELKAIQDTNNGTYYALSEWDYIDYIARHNCKDKILTDYDINYKEFDRINQDNLAVYKDMKKISASQLESYFKCPFSHFLDRVLKIEPRLDNTMLSFDVGNILHDILCQYYQNNKQVGDKHNFVTNIINEYIEKDERLKLNVQQATILNLVDEAIRMLNGVDYIDKNSAFKPSKFEYSFDTPMFDDDKINLFGRIDRIDEYENYLRIIDYKSGKADANLKELYYGNKLQLFLYSTAIERVLNKQMAGTFYLPLHNNYEKEPTTYSLMGFFIQDSDILLAFDTRLEPGKKSDIVNVTLKKDGTCSTRSNKVFDQQGMQNLKNYSVKVADQAIKEIKSGFIQPTASDVSEPCQYCPYAKICMHTCADMKIRPAKDVNLSSFNEEEKDETIC